MTPETMLAKALGEGGVRSIAGVPENTPGAVQVVALIKHKVDGVVVYTGQVYWQERNRAEAAAKNDIVHIMGKAELDWWGVGGRVLSPFAGDVERVHSTSPSPGSLKITQGCGYDPGSAAYRFHSAINQTTKHASIFTRFLDTNPHCSLRQFDGVRDAALVRESLLQADVLHCHMNYLLSANATSGALTPGDARGARPVAWRDGQWIVRHYHGSRPDGSTTMEHAVDEKVRRVAEMSGGGLLRVGARLSLCAEPNASDVQWLPISVPVERYRALRAAERPNVTPSHPFRVAHSPTKRAYKGTDKFMAAIRRLQARGMPVEAVLIENVDHATALTLKARCDATFDSLWLGLQGSGLEAGAMGMPVIAGDDDVARLYKQHVGYVPYTVAIDETGIEVAIKRLIDDRQYYEQEASRLSKYVSEYHDYPSVARRYEELLATAMGREDVITEAAAMVGAESMNEDATPAVASRSRKRGKVAA